MRFSDESNYMGGANHLEYRQCTAASRVRNQSPIVPTSSYTGEMQALFYGFGMAGVLKGLLEELLFGIGRGVCVCVWGYQPMFETIIQMRRIK